MVRPVRLRATAVGLLWDEEMELRVSPAWACGVQPSRWPMDREHGDRTSGAGGSG